MTNVPENPYDISKLDLQYPLLPGNSPRNCPTSLEDILDYLSVEAAHGEDLTEDDLEFVRTALVEGSKFWIWRFYDGDDECYVTVEVNGAVCTTFNTSDVTFYDEQMRPARLTPEQFMFAIFHKVF